MCCSATRTVAWDQFISLLAPNLDQALIRLILGLRHDGGAGSGNARLPYPEQRGDLLSRQDAPGDGSVLAGMPNTSDDGHVTLGAAGGPGLVMPAVFC